MKSTVVKEHIEELVKYLHPLLPLANSHMVDFFIQKDPLKLFFPDMITEIERLGVEDTVNKIFENNYSSLPNLERYVNLARKYDLKNCKNVCFNSEDFDNKILEKGVKDLSNMKMNVFMSSKKSHEVEYLSSICAKICMSSKTSHLIDIGDGKGYLSSFLSLHYKIPVLGIDASPVNTDGAVKRVKKLSKIWNSLSNRECNDKTKVTSSNLYKQITMFVDDKINISQVVSDIFLINPQGIGLVGLHTCGDLAANSIRLFVANKDIKTLCNVGCCYHFIVEQFENKDIPIQFGFPLSKFLQDQHFVIGRSARMIAAQSLDRILYKKELPNKTIFYRSLFEVLLHKIDPNLKTSEKQVGRFRKECSSFQEYALKAAQRLKIELNTSEEDIEKLYQKYRDRRHEINLFYLLRVLLASTIESLILLDRLLFLLENGYENSYLVHLFDTVVSPRCYGLIAIK